MHPAGIDSASSIPIQSRQARRSFHMLRYAVYVAVGALLLILAFYRLLDFPLTWFDEGSHLHVPKTLVQHGVYADISSEGFRYYGPTIGVGPTVLLPIAAVFRLFGIGLLQARLVMAFYLLATVGTFFAVARQMGTRPMAATATALLVVTPGVALIEYGRQVLGEVPGLFFLLAALALWMAAWERSGWGRLALIGLLLGLATITKSQYLLIVFPGIGLAWLMNLLYYRSAPQRVFIAPGLVAGMCVAIWEAYLVFYLGPATAAENFALLRQASEGAAFVFSPELMRASLDMLVSRGTFLGALAPALLMGVLLALPRNREGQRWGVFAILILLNLGWYVLASVGWTRYAFLGLSLASLLVAQLFAALTDDFSLNPQVLMDSIRKRRALTARELAGWAAALWLAAMVALPGALLLHKVIFPEYNAPLAMAAYLDEHIPKEALIETWEPEMGFLTDHRYHYPPAGLLDTAIGYISRGGPPPSEEYDFREVEGHSYVLVGNHGGWVSVYPQEQLDEHYRSLVRIGPYELYARLE